MGYYNILLYLYSHNIYPLPFAVSVVSYRGPTLPSCSTLSVSIAVSVVSYRGPTLLVCSILFSHASRRFPPAPSTHEYGVRLEGFHLPEVGRSRYTICLSITTYLRIYTQLYTIQFYKRSPWLFKFDLIPRAL